MFWLFWAFYGLSGFEVVLGLRGLSEGLALSVSTYAALSFLAGGLVTAAWHARFEGVGLLVWVERLPDRLLQSAQLAGLVLILGALFSRTPWGDGPCGFARFGLHAGSVPDVSGAVLQGQTAPSSSPGRAHLRDISEALTAESSAKPWLLVWETESGAKEE